MPATGLKIKLHLFVTILLCLTIGGRSRAQDIPSNYFPESGKIHGWEIKSSPNRFLENNLFDYMDGAAEIPKSYGFHALASAKYTNGSDVLEVAIFDMGSSQNANGYYSARVFLEHSPRSKERIIQLDHSAFLYENVGVLTFWKDRYTIILQPDNGKPDPKSLIAFAKLISSKIKGTGSASPLLKTLPAGKQVPNTARFIRGKAAFDATVMFSARDLFGMSNGPLAVAAEYALSGGNLTLVRIIYPTAEGATAAIALYTKMMIASKATITSGKSTVPGAFTCTTPGRTKSTGLLKRGKVILFAVEAAGPRLADAGLKMLIEN